MKLKEGSCYTFLVKGFTELPDKEMYCILSDPWNTRHLLRLSYYPAYKFNEGMYITCRLDKISCAGKIYLEPANPYYETGKVYDFEIKNIRNIMNQSGVHEHLISVADLLGNCYDIPDSRDLKGKKNGDSISYKIIRIKKGCLTLVEPSVNSGLDGSCTGQVMVCKIMRTIQLACTGDHFEIYGPDNIRYVLRKKDYDGYGFKVGDIINCTHIIYNGDHLLEPDHPIYEPGKIYNFTFAGDEANDQSAVNDDGFMIKDALDNKLWVSSHKKPDLSTGSIVTCKVIAIIRGKIHLEYLS